MTITRWVCLGCGAFTTPDPDAYGDQRPCRCYRCADTTMAVLMSFTPGPRRPRQLSLPGIVGRRRPAAYRAAVQP